MKIIRDWAKDLEYLEFALGLISGIVLAIISQIVGHYFSKRSLEAQQEHSLKVVRMQLFHEDRKKALIELDKLLKASYKSFRSFRNTVDSFLNGSTALFLPDKLRNELKKEIRDIDQFLSQKRIEIEGSPPEFDEEEHEAWLQSLDPYEAVDREVRDRLSRLKSSMMDKIKKSISEE